MISSLTALFIIFAAVIGSASMVAVFAYFLHRIRQIEAGTGGDAGSQQLSGEVSQMREELLAVQEEMSALFGSFHELAGEPESTVLRDQVLVRGQRLIDRMQGGYQRLVERTFLPLVAKTIKKAPAEGVVFN